MNEEIMTLINNISNEVYNGLSELNNTRIEQLNELIDEEKDFGKKELLINEKKQLISIFRNQVISYIKDNLTEQQIKSILTLILNYNNDFFDVYNSEYLSSNVENDILYYVLRGICSSMLDKDFISGLSEKYFIQLTNGKMYETINQGDYHRSLLLLSYCKNTDLKTAYIKQHLNNDNFVTQFASSSFFEENILIEYTKDLFEKYSGDQKRKREITNYYYKLLHNEVIPVTVRKKITDIFSLKFPKEYNSSKISIYKELITDYNSAISYILDSHLLDGIVIDYVLSDCKLKGEDLIKIYNDERIINKLTQDYIIINPYTDSITKYNILFHTLLTRYIMDKDVMYSTIQINMHDQDFLYEILTHSDSLSYILKNQEITKQLLDEYLKNLNNNQSANIKFLEVFKDILTPEQINTIFKANRLPYDEYMKFYLTDKYCYKILNIYHPIYNPNGEKDKIRDIKTAQDLIARLYNDNKYLFKTFNPDIISDEILKFDYKFVSLISKYPSLQRRICYMINKKDDTLAKIGIEDEWIQSIKKDPLKYQDFIESSKKTHAEMRPIDAKICGHAFINMLRVLNDIDADYLNEYVQELTNISYIKNVYYDEFHDAFLRDNATLFEKFVINACQGLDINTITPEQWKTLTKVFLHDANLSFAINSFTGETIYYPLSRNEGYISVDINNLEDINTYDERRREKLDKLFIKSLNDREIEYAINVFLNKYYDIDIKKAREIVEMYELDVSLFKDNKYIKNVNLLKKIKHVLNISNLQELYVLYQTEVELSFEDTMNFRNSFNKMFGHSLVESLTKFSGMRLVNNDQLNFPSSITVYEAPDDFIMLVHSKDGYGKSENINNNYKTSFNESDRTSNHGICCSLIANDYLGTAEIKDVLFGFNDFSASALIKSAPYDIFSFNDDVKITSSKKSKFFTPRNIINNTRHAHNEQVIERRELRKELIDEGVINLQPSYVIVFSDMTEELKNNALKCAKDFGIPVVYIDKQKVVQNESNKIDKMIDNLKNTNDIATKIDIFSEIYLKHENNRCGLMHDENLKNMFSSSRIETVLNDIVDRLIDDKNNTHDYEKYCENVLKLIEILKREEDKFITCYETGSRVAFNDIDIDKYIVKMYREIDSTLCEGNNSKLSTITSTLNSDDSLLSIGLNDIDAKKVEQEIKTFNETDFYAEDFKNHNLGHIERVTVLASMIGKKEIADNEHARYLLRLSAELHDSGRKTDEKDFNHARESALHARNALQSKLSNGEISENDLHIIQFAIEYHEFDHVNYDGEHNLKLLAQKYEIGENDFEEAKKIAECLKDADALDRVRFHNRNAMLDERRLITTSSHDYINTAKMLLEEYKNYDKNQFTKKIKEKCKEREERHNLFKRSELKYKMKSKFEKIVAHLKIFSSKNQVEGDLNEVRRR